MTAIYLCQVKKLLAEGDDDGRVKAFNIWSSPLRKTVVIRRFPIQSSKPSVSALNHIICSFFSSIPLPSCHVEPEIYSIRRCGFPAYRIKKEDLLDPGRSLQAHKTSTPQPKREAEWLMKAGLERPRKTLNLARDAIETSVLNPHTGFAVA